MVALCVFTEIVAAQHNVASGNERNVAREAGCTCSSSHPLEGRTCDLVKNGDRDSSNYNVKRNCFSSLEGERGSLRFILKHKYFIHRLVFYAREDRLDRMDCLQVYFDDKVIHTFPKNNKERILYLNRSESESREVKNASFSRTCKTGMDVAPVLNFCELEIYTCALRKWGRKCDQPCHHRCLTCKGDSNTCLDCSKDYWGPNCMIRCSKTCNRTEEEGYCNEFTGRCEKGCRRGYWGHNCTNACGQGCGNTCNPRDGKCGCRHGWKPPMCEVPLCTCGGAECAADNKYVFSEIPRKINVAVGKNSTASTTLDDPKPVSGPACLANNGKTQSTMLPISASAPECMSTAEGDLKPFWEVDLGEKYVVAGILIDWDNQTCRPGYYGPDCLGICDRPVCDNLQICSRIDGSCPKDPPVEVKELTVRN
ncbi:multiple epidermal growth factor-like domains protein 11 isoform X2 [Pomacea canaliculata]|uniref:multiple epidermal growth factor-like domains protein 11 isoform X2 n=1 Tax=Pomacea canaliculata TaxID=400727 RepID=UPI000D7339DE|nr:multiple epidermal growth factor-like domains protein 11 isoform X2 [Pomacea canaliculata]